MPGFSYDLPSPQWKKSSRCDNSGPNCVEVASIAGDMVQVRNNQRPEVVASFSREEWTTFLAGAKAGEFDI